MKKRIISMLLALCLLAGMIPAVTPEADAVVGAIIETGLSLCKSVINGSIATAKNVDHYDGNVGKCILGQFRNIAADFTGLDIGEDYGDGNDQVVADVSLDVVRSEIQNLSKLIEDNNAAIHQLEETVTDGIDNLSKKMDELSTQIKDTATRDRYYTYLTEFFSFFNQYYEGISFYSEQVSYAVEDQHSEAYMKNLFDQFYHLQNVEYTGNLHSAVDKLSKYLRGEYMSSDPGSVVDVLSRYYILAYKDQGKSEADAQKLAAQDTEEAIANIYYAYCMGIYYEEMVAMYQSGYMADQATNEYKTDFGTYISERQMTANVKTLFGSVQDTAASILTALLNNYPWDSIEMPYCSTWDTKNAKREYWYTRTVSADGFKVIPSSYFYLPDPANLISPHFSDALSNSLVGLMTYASGSGDGLIISGKRVTVGGNVSDDEPINETRLVNICAGDVVVGTIKVNVEWTKMWGPTGQRRFWDGDGSRDFPYLIVNDRGLQCIKYDTRAFYVLGQDLGAEWVTGFTFDTIPAFYGVLDGNGHTIYNLKIRTAADDDYNTFLTTYNIYTRGVGMFGALYGKVRNLNIQDPDVSYTTNAIEKPYNVYAGTIAGVVIGGNIYRCQVVGGSVKLKVERNENYDVKKYVANCGNVFAGGLAGGIIGGGAYANGEEPGVINSCSVRDVSVDAETVIREWNAAAGGLVGVIGINQSQVRAIHSYEPYFDYWGEPGQSCVANGTGKVEGCQVYNVEVEHVSAKSDNSTVSGWAAAGGVVGELANGTLMNVWAGSWNDPLSAYARTGTAYTGQAVGKASGGAECFTGNFADVNLGLIPWAGGKVCGDLENSALTKLEVITTASAYEASIWTTPEDNFVLPTRDSQFYVLKTPSATPPTPRNVTEETYMPKAYLVPPTKTVYASGEMLDLSGMKVYAPGINMVNTTASGFCLSAETLELMNNPMTAGKHTLEVITDTGVHLTTEITVYNSHIYFEERVEATCGENGTSRLVCVDCGAVKNEKTIPALGHRIVIDPAVEPNCASSGLSEGSHCDRCGEIIEKQQVLPSTGEHGHTIVPGYAATCTTDGLTDKDYCEGCGLVHTEASVIPAFGHDMVSTTVLAPTCTAGGMTQEKCSHCGAYGDLKNIDPLGHDYQVTVVEPTCEEPGYTVHTCNRCADTYTDHYVAPTGHVYGQGAVTTEPTCTAEGVMTYTCSCGATHTEPIARIAHDYQETVIAPTCTELGYTEHTCAACGDLYRDSYVNPTGHHYDGGVVTTEPTCTEKGVRTYTCHCGDSYTESIDMLAHAYGAELFAPTCTELGYTLHTCAHCGDTYRDSFVSALGHDWDEGTVVRVPTLLETGLLVRCCKHCDEMHETILPKLGGCEDSCCPSSRFTDVPGRDNWAHSGIDYMLEFGLFDGTSQTTFEPNLTMTRAMLVTVLYRFEGQPEVSGEPAFRDVPADEWFTEAVTWASEQGVVNGMGDGTFAPNAQITREQLAAILYRYSELKGYDLTASAELDAFPDADQVGAWALPAVQWACGAGLINGIATDGVNYLSPTGSATRAQVCAIIMRYILSIVGEGE